jgi:hypothetical protein
MDKSGEDEGCVVSGVHEPRWRGEPQYGDCRGNVNNDKDDEDDEKVKEGRNLRMKTVGAGL